MIKFSFQIEKLCKKNDVLFLFSVSRNSPNLVEAIKAAKNIGAKIVSFTGFNSGKLAKMSDYNINFPIANFRKILFLFLLPSPLNGVSMINMSIFKS